MKYLHIAALVFVVGCSGSSPTAPTPAPTPPPPVATPPPTTQPPSTPTITVYTGRWVGQYIVEQCAGNSGSMDDVLCSAPRGSNPGGLFQRGTSLPITLDLTQVGSAINGTWALGGIVGTVTGSVVSNRLILSGSSSWSDGASGFVFSNTITMWDTVLDGGSLSGGFSMNVRINMFPGDGVVRVRLSNVRR